MADEPTGANDQAPPAGDGTPPRPNTQPQGSDQGSGGSGLSVEAVVEQAADMLEDRLGQRFITREEADQTIQSRFDSNKDSRFHLVEQVAKYVKEAGGDVRKAAREMVLDEVAGVADFGGLVPQANQEPSGEPASGGTQAGPRVPQQQDPDELQDQFDTVTTEILQGAGIPFNDQEVVELANNFQVPKGADPVEAWELTLSRHVRKRQKQGNVSPASLQGEGGSPPPSNPDLQSQYEKELEQIRPGDAAGLAALKAKYREKGLDVW